MISRLRGRITRANVDEFFKARFTRMLDDTRQAREKKVKINPEDINETLTIAFYINCISPYLSTIKGTEYGKALGNPELKWLNLTKAYDQKT